MCARNVLEVGPDQESVRACLSGSLCNHRSGEGANAEYVLPMSVKLYPWASFSPTYVVAKRDIAVGEEITLDYGYAIDDLSVWEPLVDFLA